MRSGIIVASGNSSRYGDNKLTEILLGKSVLQHSVDSMLVACDELIVVCDVDYWHDKLPQCIKLVNGGSTRHQSVRAGLSMLDSSSHVVAIHDGARPYINSEFVAKLFAEAEQYGNAIASTAVTDTIYMTTPIDRIDRDQLVAVQTPQVFSRDSISSMLSGDSDTATDEAQLYLDKVGQLHFVNMQSDNHKITFAGSIPQYRVGVGYDLHRLTGGSGIILGGVGIDCNKALVAHSDGDVVIHAIMDSLLSAMGDKDIGTHFPDSDSAYKGISSMQLLDKVLSIVHKNYQIINISCVIIAQEPKMSPYIDSMVRNIANALSISQDCVGITATTTEQLGVIGQGNAIAVNASCLVHKII